MGPLAPQCARTFQCRPNPHHAGCVLASAASRAPHPTAQNSHTLLPSYPITCNWHSRYANCQGAPAGSRAVAAAAATADRRDYRKERMERKGKSSDRRRNSSDRQDDRQEDRQDRRPGPPATGQHQRFSVFKGRRDVGLKQDFFARESWKQLGANADMIDALKQLGITRPSHVQAEALVSLFSEKKRVVVADQSGSGKTLAYLVPLIQHIKEQERAAGGPQTQPRKPRAVVLCPTEELCAQVLLNCRALSKVLKFRAAAFTGGHKMSHHNGMLKEGVDIAVCTPGRLKQLLQASLLSLDLCQVLVLDEVDVLLGGQGAFTEEVAPLVARSVRTVFVTATLPEPMFLHLKSLYPDLVAAVGPNLHRISTGVTEQLVDCSGGDEITLEAGQKRKLDALAELLGRHSVPRTIVFCNKIETCRSVENFLNRREEKQRETSVVLPCHAAIAPHTRQSNLRTFLGPPQPAEPTQVLVCTDRASRGIDSVHVEHVVLFDLPRDPSEYVRRVGRTARGTLGTGHVSVLVLGRQVKLAQEIINRNQKGMPVHTVPRMHIEDFTL